MFKTFIWYGQRLLAGSMMLAVLAAHAPGSTAMPLEASELEGNSPPKQDGLKQDGLKQDGLKQETFSSNAFSNDVFGPTEARRLTRRRPDRSLRRRPPRPPRRLPPNLVQPGGGLDAAAQSCDPDGQPLTALVPVQNPVFTASAHPTFLFYLPDSPEQVDYAEFILLSADEKEEIYAAQFVPMKTGVVSISLPAASAPALEANQVYHWYLNLHCQTPTAKEVSGPAVNGWVQRLPESEPVIDEIAANTVGEEASNAEVPEVPKVWYDAIAQVAETLTDEASLDASQSAPGQPNETRALWESWLSAVGLEEVANAPVVGEVTPE